MLAETVAGPSLTLPLPDPAALASLRARIERIARSAGTACLPEALPLGLTAVDSVLPGGGLARGCLHEIGAADAGAAAAGFAAVLLARLAGTGSALWIRRYYGPHGSKLYGPGIAAFGLDLRRLLVVHARREADLLWTIEESLRSGAASAVLGEVAAASPIALRRLQLAAEVGGATGLLLRPPGASAEGWATSRWRIASVPSQPLAAGSPQRERDRPPAVRWRVELVRCRAAAPTSWLLDWCYETHCLAVVAELRDGPAAPAAKEYGRRVAG